MNKTELKDMIREVLKEELAKMITVSDTAPANAQVGAIWIDTSVTSVASAEGVEF